MGIAYNNCDMPIPIIAAVKIVFSTLPTGVCSKLLSDIMYPIINQIVMAIAFKIIEIIMPATILPHSFYFDIVIPPLLYFFLDRVYIRNIMKCNSIFYIFMKQILAALPNLVC